MIGSWEGGKGRKEKKREQEEKVSRAVAGKAC